MTEKHYNVKIKIHDNPDVSSWNWDGGMEYLKGTVQMARIEGNSTYVKNTNEDFPNYFEWNVSGDYDLIEEVH